MLHHSAKKNTKKGSEGEEKKSEISLEPEPKIEKSHVSHCLLYKNPWQFFLKIKILMHQGVKRGGFFVGNQ